MTMAFHRLFSRLTLISLILLSTSHVQGEKIDVRIVIGGRNGMGISSTVRELIGSATKCDEPEGEVGDVLNNIYEYTLTSIPSESETTYEIKLIEVPGLVDDRTSLQDAQILATLKSYITALGQPDFFLAVSGFDEDRFNELASPFVHFLQRLELFSKEYLDKSSQAKMNVAFLLTRFMRETKTIQRNPTEKLNQFRQVIQEHSFSPSNYSIIVGDNEAESLGATVVNGYYRLRNRQFYPKNVWEILISFASTISSKSNSTYAASSWQAKIEAITAIKNNREVNMSCVVKVRQVDWDEYNSDASAFQYLLENHDVTVEENEVNLEIDRAYNELQLTSNKDDAIVQKTALQLYLQTEGVTTRTNLPRGFLRRLDFFQKSPLVSSTYPALLLSKTFGLRMPEYMEPQTVGYGYDVVKDRIMEIPIKTDRYFPSSVGLQLPNFVKCWKLPAPQTKTFHSYSQNVSEYFEERLKQLKFGSKENVANPAAYFTGDIKEGFNLPLVGEEDSEVAMLTALKEVRIAKCQISQRRSFSLKEVFKTDFNALAPLNVSNNGSVTQWKGFFGKYGTHIIVGSYGGGALTGSVAGTYVKHLQQSNNKSRISEILTSILEFTKMSEPGLDPPIYKLGSSQANLYDMSGARRHKILEDWSKSLNLDFIMLANELSLKRISTVVNDPVKAEMVDAAIDQELNGKLELRVETEVEKNSYQRILEKITNQTRSSQMTTNNQIDYIRRLDEVADLVHRKFIEQLERKEEIERLCGGIRIFDVRCWKRELFQKEE